MTNDDVDMIEDMVGDIHFMHKLPKELRRETIRAGKLRRFACDEYIFKQGDLGTSMFLILVGSVNVLINRKNPRDGLMAEFVRKENNIGCCEHQAR